MTARVALPANGATRGVAADLAAAPPLTSC